jgi:hypothetical protein
LKPFSLPLGFNRPTDLTLNDVYLGQFLHLKMLMTDDFSFLQHTVDV